jgi:hypothetical protein
VIWKVLGLFGSGTFIVGGFNIAIDPNCDSVSFRGGGARSVLTTCYADTTGDFSKSVAATGSFLVAIAILIVIFWTEINVYIRNLEFRKRFESGLEAAKASYEEKSDITLETSAATKKEPREARSRFQYYLMHLTQRAKRHKIVSILLVLVLIFGFYTVVAPKIPLFDSLTCSGIRSDVKELDIVRRDIWNQYQIEVSRLGQINFDEYEVQDNQVRNVARRMVQLKSSDLEVLDKVLQNEHCLTVDKYELIKTRLVVKDDLDFLQGTTKRNGENWNPYSGWNSEYYRVFTNLIELVDK